MDDFLGMETPTDLAAEQAVIGAILLEPEVLGTVTGTVQSQEFDSVAHQRIFDAVVGLSEEGQPLDLVSLTARLADQGDLDDIGGVSYLAELSGAVPTTANAGYYADRVHEMYSRRQTLKTVNQLYRAAAEGQDTKDFVILAEAAIAKLADMSKPAREFVGMKDVLMQVWEDTESKYNNRDTNRGITGIESGYPDLDRMTAGFQRSDLILVAARPSVGKTALALNIAQNVAVRTGETIGIFSLEMSATQLVQRMICSDAQIDASRMRTGYFEGDDWERMSMSVGTLSNAQIFIDDSPGITVNEIRAKCRRLKKEKGLGMILIDYLQLIQGSGRRGANRQEEVSQISRTLKQLARELDVPVIALSQLSRGVEQRQDKRPMMSDLRESGALEQDADLVAFLYRDDYYDKQTEKKNIIEIIIAKQRNGPVGTVELVFLKQFNKFVSIDRTESGPQNPVGKPIPDMNRGNKGRRGA